MMEFSNQTEFNAVIDKHVKRLTNSKNNSIYKDPFTLNYYDSYINDLNKIKTVQAVAIEEMVALNYNTHYTNEYIKNMEIVPKFQYYPIEATWALYYIKKVNVVAIYDYDLIKNRKQNLNTEIKEKLYNELKTKLDKEFKDNMYNEFKYNLYDEFKHNLYDEFKQTLTK
jgi:hypothetical protein